jgi:hypothetical protein
VGVGLVLGLMLEQGSVEMYVLGAGISEHVDSSRKVQCSDMY